MNVIAAIVYVLAAAVGGFAANDPPEPFPAIKDWNSLVISLHHGCGRAPPTCPVYEVTIAGNGDVTFNGMRAVRAMGEHTAHISQAAVRALVAKFRAAKFFMLPDTRVMDSSSRVTIAFDDHEKSLPGEVSHGLADAINKAAGTARWVMKSDATP